MFFSIFLCMAVVFAEPPVSVGINDLAPQWNVPPTVYNNQYLTLPYNSAEPVYEPINTDQQQNYGNFQQNNEKYHNENIIVESADTNTKEPYEPQQNNYEPNEPTIFGHNEPNNYAKQDESTSETLYATNGRKNYVFNNLSERPAATVQFTPPQTNNLRKNLFKTPIYNNEPVNQSKNTERYDVSRFEDRVDGSISPNELDQMDPEKTDKFYDNDNKGSNGYDYREAVVVEPASYQFSYEVNDPTGGNQYGHREARFDSRAEGSYFVMLPDGVRQIVEYSADEHGFQPRITFETPSLKTNGPY